MQWTIWLIAALFSALCGASEVSVAVASNFTAPMRELARDFESTTGHAAVLSFGSSGKFYAQIINGAPFEVFLSADREKPGRLEQVGKVMPGSRFTYAEGRLALWSGKPEYRSRLPDALVEGDYRTLAIANPTLAPYGAAALETLTHLGIERSGIPRLVQGENIAQTYQFTATGNADLGFVALSQVIADNASGGKAWTVPADMHSPIRQDAVLLVTGRDNPAARALMDYLQSPAAGAIIEAFGYSLPPR